MKLWLVNNSKIFILLNITKMILLLRMFALILSCHKINTFIIVIRTWKQGFLKIIPKFTTLIYFLLLYKLLFIILYINSCMSFNLSCILWIFEDIIKLINWSTDRHPRSGVLKVRPAISIRYIIFLYNKMDFSYFFVLIYRLKIYIYITFSIECGAKR